MSTALKSSLLLLLFCAPMAAQQWTEVRSQHFSLITDAGEKRGREVLERFEQMRAAFGVLLVRGKVNIPVPVQIVAFSGGKQMRPYAPLFDSKPVELSGFFQAGEDRHFIVLDLSSEARWEMVWHEYAHLLINGNLPPTALWYDEGFAEYSSSLRLTGKTIEFGLVPERSIRVLQQYPWLKLLDLFAVSHDDKTYNTGDHRSVFYAQSWITVHYLMAHQMFPQLGQYLDLVGKRGLSPADAVRQAFQMDAEQLQRKIREYFSGGRYTYYRAPAPENIDGGPYQAHPLQNVEALAVLADLHYHSRDHRERGIAEFKEVLAKQPDNPAANRGLGYVYLRQNDFDRAAEHFRRAAVADSNDPRVHYFSALLQSREAMMASREPADLSGMRQQLNKAISLDPNYADAYNLMAYVEATSGNLEAALADATQAVQLSPRNDMYLANLAQYQLQAHKWDDARLSLERLQDSDNLEIAAAAARNLDHLNDVRQHPRTLLPKPSPAGGDPTAPQWRPSPEPSASQASQPEPAAESTPTGTQTIRHLYGTLLDVDCSSSPGAVLNIKESGNAWKMRTADRNKLLLMGADEFSCSWKNRKVLVNFRETAPGEGDMVTLELK